MKQISVNAIILAAGEGKRAGKPKWKLLTDSNETFLTTIVTKLIAAGINNIICVARPNSIPIDSRITITINANPELGMFSSIYCGIAKAVPASGYLIFPVDHPYVTENTISLLLKSFSQYSDQIICPAYNSSSGHPIILPEFVAKKITLMDYPGGLRRFLQDQNFAVLKVSVNDANVMRNINEISANF